MAEEKTTKLEREYVVPLRREYLRVARYRRTGRAVTALKKFIAKHMKVPERDLDKVKLDVYLNNELWFRGKTNPPSKIKVKAIKEGDIVNVTFAETPEYVKFLKSKHLNVHAKSEKKESKEVPETKMEERSGEEKKNEIEKEKSTELQNIKEAKVAENVKMHTTKVEKKIHPVRQALKK